MDAETSAMVEALYASGKVERPKNGQLFLYLSRRGFWEWKEGEASWCAGAIGEEAESVIGWSLLEAIHASLWTLHPMPAFYEVRDHTGVVLSRKPGPIAAMVAALDGDLV